MIKLFRNTRRRLLRANRFANPASSTGRYLLYAVGEIVLVVIGILIALQLNTWNSNRIQQEEIQTTYRNMLEEIASTQTQMQQKYTLIENVLISKNKRSLQLMKLKNKDSIHKIYETLIAVSNVVTVVYDMPTTSEFLNDRNITGIKNTKLKEILLHVKRNLRFGQIVDTYAANQLNTLIEPYLTKNLNYAMVVEGRDMLEINTTDHAIFFDNLELENLINLKIETDNTKIDYLRTFERVLNNAHQEISNQLVDSD